MPRVANDMIIMETPKARKLRRTKETSKKTRVINVDAISETKSNRIEEACTSRSNITPPRSKLGRLVERGQEEIRSVEWQYYGKFVESDIPVVWGSPQGSPVMKPVKLAASPVSLPKPKNVSCAPRHITCDEYEPPQFLNEILALSERIKAQEEIKSQVNSTNVENNSVESRKIENNLDESYSNLFDESMNECLLQCSQEYEATCAGVAQCIKIDSSTEGVINNNRDLLKCNPSNISPRRILTISNETKPSSSTSTVFPVDNSTKGKGLSRVGNKNYVNGKRKMNTYVFQGRVLGTRTNIATNNEKQPVSSNTDKKKSSVLQSCNKVAIPEQRSKLMSVNDSFETIKESFFEEDLDLLSTIPIDVDIANIPDIPGNNQNTYLEREHVLKINEKYNNKEENVSSTLDDSTYFEEGVLQLLDSIESNVTSCSQKLRCTPEEIEKKRLEAKSKLEKKRRSHRHNL